MSTFGTLFRVTTYGESHGQSVGCIVDGVPPGLFLSEEDIQIQLRRRRPGQNTLTTQRNEQDLVHLHSGIEDGITLGTPIGMIIYNEDCQPSDYEEIKRFPRPSHADLTYLQKYGIKSSTGGGRSSSRETIGRVAAGAIAEKYLSETYKIEIVAFVSSIGKIQMEWDMNQEDNEDDIESPISQAYLSFLSTVTREQVDASLVRCPNMVTSAAMIARIERAKENQDSIGGTITCVIRNLPAGLGEPCFDKLEAKLAHAMLSIPSTKGFEVGSGFKGTQVPGSKHNDPYIMDTNNKLRTVTNNSGGIQGGISNGENVFFKVAFKSPASIGKQQFTSSYEGTNGMLFIKGRHDPNVASRAVPIVECMAALVIMDALMIQLSRQTARSLLPPIKTKISFS
ncbi:chorismate synthase [Pneumocystis murina B123]|uniref:Chorismate synthase n=1 Tax=Pneumocystis murina (strain B123) TaxID=1069680 RepID=M7NSQ8_PNEMU|nr:chorismate synthase [Pneumocystis murina B123]EMR10156.1 chorismate synthase [Pneumocystis murina B123]